MVGIAVAVAVAVAVRMGSGRLLGGVHAIILYAGSEVHGVCSLVGVFATSPGGGEPVEAEFQTTGTSRTRGKRIKSHIGSGGEDGRITGGCWAHHAVVLANGDLHY